MAESTVKHVTSLPQFDSSVTALSWLGLDRPKNVGLLAVGMENGLIELWNLSGKGGEVTKIPEVTVSIAVRLDPLMCHVASVNRLAWRDREKSVDCRSMQLASCGADHCVRIFQVDVD